MCFPSTSSRKTPAPGEKYRSGSSSASSSLPVSPRIGSRERSHRRRPTQNDADLLGPPPIRVSAARPDSLSSAHGRYAAPSAVRRRKSTKQSGSHVSRASSSAQSGAGPATGSKRSRRGSMSEGHGSRKDSPATPGRSNSRKPRDGKSRRSSVPSTPRMSSVERTSASPRKHKRSGSSGAMDKNSAGSLATNSSAAKMRRGGSSRGSSDVGSEASGRENRRGRTEVSEKGGYLAPPGGVVGLGISTGEKYTPSIAPKMAPLREVDTPAPTEAGKETPAPEAMAAKAAILKSTVPPPPPEPVKQPEPIVEAAPPPPKPVPKLPQEPGQTVISEPSSRPTMKRSNAFASIPKSTPEPIPSQSHSLILSPSFGRRDSLSSSSSESTISESSSSASDSTMEVAAPEVARRKPNAYNMTPKLRSRPRMRPPSPEEENKPVLNLPAPPPPPRRRSSASQAPRPNLAHHAPAPEPAPAPRRPSARHASASAPPPPPPAPPRRTGPPSSNVHHKRPSASAPAPQPIPSTPMRKTRERETVDYAAFVAASAKKRKEDTVDYAAFVAESAKKKKERPNITPIDTSRQPPQRRSSRRTTPTTATAASSNSLATPSSAYAVPHSAPPHSSNIPSKLALARLPPNSSDSDSDSDGPVSIVANGAVAASPVRRVRRVDPLGHHIHHNRHHGINPELATGYSTSADSSTHLPEAPWPPPIAPSPPPAPQRKGRDRERYPGEKTHRPPRGAAEEWYPPAGEGMREVEQDWGQAGEVWDADEGDGKERRVDSEGRMPSAPTPPPGSVGGWSDMSGW